MKTKNNNVSFIQMILTIALVTAIVYTNLITGRQISVFGITMTGGTFVFPLTFVLSDIFQEVYGYKWSRISSYIGFIIFGVFSIANMIFVNLPTPDHFQFAEAYTIVLGNTPRILIASLSAFFFGDLVNDKIFDKMRASSGFMITALISSVGGQAIDELVFNVIGFYGKMPIKDLIISIPAGIIFSLLVEIILVPITYKIANKLKKIEN